MIAIAARTPDHGKLAPWRFVIVDDRAALATLITDAYRAERPQAARTEIESLEQFAHQAPALVVVLSSPSTTSHIPRWEQELSAGAATMNLLHAAHAMGFAGGWLTGWPTFSDVVRDAFGGPHERIAGFVFLGTPGRPLDERPVRSGTRDQPLALIARILRQVRTERFGMDLSRDWCIKQP